MNPIVKAALADQYDEMYWRELTRIGGGKKSLASIMEYEILCASH